MRGEIDSIGSIDVPDNKYWGAQTQRALRHFAIGNETFPRSFIRAMGIIKRSAGIANLKQQRLLEKDAAVIIETAGEVAEGSLDEHFPLSIWQSGSGTQMNMNVNEVIANLSIEKLGGTLGSMRPIHPNDHVNISQSSNDVISTAMHISAAEQLNTDLIPTLQKLHAALLQKVQAWSEIVKLGRTHLQDATPITLGQEFSGYARQIELGIERLQALQPRLLQLPLGGTAVGTGLNTIEGFDKLAVQEIANFTGLRFETSPNKFEGIATHDVMVELSGAMNTLAASLFKIAQDIRFLGSGPRSGLGELLLPQNEPGSSIMPGKVNPTQCEAVTMVCTQVIGNHVTITMAGSQGNFELNVFKPVIIHNVLQSLTLLSDAARSFTTHCIDGLSANETQIENMLERSLMLVTALAPQIGYDQAAKIAKTAFTENRSLRDVAIDSGVITKDAFDAAIDPIAMTKPASPNT